MAAKTTNKSLKPAKNSVSGNNMTHNTLKLKLKIISLYHFMESKAEGFETFQSSNVGWVQCYVYIMSGIYFNVGNLLHSTGSGR